MLTATLKDKIINENLVIPLLGMPGVYLTETTIRENLKDEEIQFDTLSALVSKYKPDGIFPFMDLTVEAEALGLKVNFPEQDNPAVANHPVKTLADLKELKNNWSGISGRMKVFTRLMEMMDSEMDIIKGGYVIGPFTLAGEMMGPTDIATNVLLKSELVQELLKFSVEVITKFTEELFAAGADTVAVLEPTAVVLSPEQYQKFSQDYFEIIRENINFKPLILHICGDTAHLLPAMSESGALGLSLDSQVDMGEADKIIGKDMVLMGNINPTEVFLQGTVSDVKEAVMDLGKKMAERDNFIFSSGCDIPLNTPSENIKAFMETARKY